MLLGRGVWRSFTFELPHKPCHGVVTQRVALSAAFPDHYPSKYQSLRKLRRHRQQTRWLSDSISSRTARGEGEASATDVEQTPDARSPSPARSSASVPLDASSPHNSLTTFQAYANRTGLSQTSTVYTGTTYEYLTQSSLRPYGFDLHRVGGRGDRGVDLIGLWRIPLVTSSGNWKEKTTITITGSTGHGTELDRYETQPLRVLVQCKRLVGRSAKIGPHLIRELDGAVRGARSTALFDVVFPRNSISETSGEGIQADTDVADGSIQPTPSYGPSLGVLVTTKPATKGVVDSMRRSTRGLVWIMMEEAGNLTFDAALNEKEEVQDTEQNATGSLRQTTEISVVPDDGAEVLLDQNANQPAALLQGCVKQILWNQAARELGLEGVDVVKRYDGNGNEEVVLMRGGRVWGGS